MWPTDCPETSVNDNQHTLRVTQNNEDLIRSGVEVWNLNDDILWMGDECDISAPRLPLGCENLEHRIWKCFVTRSQIYFKMVIVPWRWQCYTLQRQSRPNDTATRFVQRLDRPTGQHDVTTRNIKIWILNAIKASRLRWLYQYKNHRWA